MLLEMIGVLVLLVLVGLLALWLARTPDDTEGKS